MVGPVHTKPFSGPIRLLREVEHIWSWFPYPATTSKAPVHREQEAAQTHLKPVAKGERGEQGGRGAIMNKDALGLSLVSRGEFHFRAGGCRVLVVCRFRGGP